MIDLILYYGTEIIFIRIDGGNITFHNSNFGVRGSTIEGLNLSYPGVLKEFPDLEDNPDWRHIAIKRFKDKINKMDNEDKIAEYLVKDLKMHGYVPKFKQKHGFRRELIK